MTRTAIIIPTPDATTEPARTAIATARRTTRDLDAVIHAVESSGPDFTFSGSINQGLKATEDADAWVLLNDDCFMDDGWLEAMLATADAHPEVGLVGALLRYPDGRIQHAGGIIALTPWEYVALAARRKAPFWAMREMARRRRLFDTHFFTHYRRVRPGMRLDFITAACVLITRECRDRVGLYDERYPLGSEDIDHSLRCLEAGLELALAREATGTHLEGASTGRMSPKKRRSIEIFRDRWPAQRVRELTRGRTGFVHPPLL